MRASRRTCLLHTATIGASALLLPDRLWSSSLSGPLNLVVPFAPGGGPDLLTRALARSLEARLKQAVVVVNRPGAGGLIGTEIVVRSPADGRTLLVSSVTTVIQGAMNPRARIDPLRDFDHITQTGTGYSVVVVKPQSPYRQLDDLLTALRRQPGALAYGSGGIGTPAHLCAQALLTAVGSSALHIPYRGSVDIAPALDSGDIQFSCLVQSTALPLIRQGRLRALAVSSGAPAAALSELPTLKAALRSEDVVLESWTGLSAAAGSPKAWLQSMHEAVRASLTEQELRALAAQADVDLVSSASPAAFAEFVERELRKFRRLTAAAGLIGDAGRGVWMENTKV